MLNIKSTTSAFASAAMLLGLLTLSAEARIANDLQRHDGDIEVRDFAFQDGERLPLLTLHYTTLGTPQRDATGKVSNAVLLLHGTTGTGTDFLRPTVADHMFRPGQPSDAQRSYIVLPDAIGAGHSSKPSDGLQARFPHYGYVDKVEAQHAMLQALGIDHLRLVSGISQGGMLTWLWAERFPEAMDAFVPVACMPMQISGRNLMWREIVIHAIRNDPDWHGGTYDPAHPPTLWIQVVAPLFTLMVSTAERLQDMGPDRAKTLASNNALVHQWDGRDANDTLYDVASSADYDPAFAVDRIKAPMLAVNFADDEINPIQLIEPTRQTVARLPSGQLVVAPGGYGHTSGFHVETWVNQLGAWLDQQPGWKTDHQ
jgi:homoserine O-acetyltransferase/O-succinyltransferase